MKNQERIWKAISAIRDKFQRRLDSDDDGQWVTTENGKKIHFNESGAPDKGSQFALAVMGKPKNATIPKKKIEIHEEKPFKTSYETLDQLGDALASREEKDTCFGGFYKVEQSGGSFQTAKFFNPYTGAFFSSQVGDLDNDMVHYNKFYSELRDIKINKDVSWLWKRCNGVVQEGDKIKVVKGKTIPKGTTAKVRAIYPFRNKYKMWVADYAYLDNGQKINVNNVEIVED